MTLFTNFFCRALCLGTFLIIGSLLAAQSPQLLADINPGSASSVPVSFWGVNNTADGVSFAGYFYFAANDGAHGIELWRTDGSVSGTQMVKDINPGAGESRPIWLTVVGNQVLFFAKDGVHGLELWRSDGTEAGTQLVKDIKGGAADALRPDYAPQVRDVVALNGFLYFSADSGNHYGQLWRSDGTANGTTLIKSVCPGCNGDSIPSAWFTTLGNDIYFVGGRDIWKSDGTTAGTVIIQNHNSGPGNNFEYLRGAGGKLYYAALKANTYDVEPYVSDGSVGGAHLLKDVVPGNIDGSHPRQFTSFQDKVYFIANQELWVTDGTGPGTTLFSTLTTGDYLAHKAEGQNLLVANDRLYFNAREGGNDVKQHLYVTDGQPDQIVDLAETNSYSGFSDLGLVQFGQKICFWGQKNEKFGIWITNGIQSNFYPTSNNGNFYAQDLWIANERLFLVQALSNALGWEPYQLKLTPEVALSATLLQTDSIACFGEHTASLQVETAGGIPPYQYNWNVAGVTGANPSGLAAGTYKITVTDAGLNTVESAFTLTGPSMLALTFQIAPASGGFPNGSAEASATGGVPPYDFSWDNGVSLPQNPNLAAGTYGVTVSDDNGCTTTAQVVVGSVSGLTEIQAEEQWEIFPTPVYNSLNMRWTGVPLTDAGADLIDRYGHVVRSWEVEVPESNFDCSGLPAGQYLLHLQAKEYSGYRSVLIVY